MQDRTGSIILAALAAGGFVIAAGTYLWMPEEDAFVVILVGVAGFSVGATSLATLVDRWMKRRKALRLMDGEGLVTRWRVPPAEWERFRRFEKAYARGAGRRLFRPMPHPSGRGVDVYVGDRGIVVDGEWLSLKPLGNTGPAYIAWHPTDPPCIEVCHEAGSDTLSLQSYRVPVPAHAVADGRRVFEYWDRLIRTEGSAEFRQRWSYDPGRKAG